MSSPKLPICPGIRLNVYSIKEFQRFSGTNSEFNHPLNIRKYAEESRGLIENYRMPKLISETFQLDYEKYYNMYDHIFSFEQEVDFSLTSSKKFLDQLIYKYDHPFAIFNAKDEINMLLSFYLSRYCSIFFHEYWFCSPSLVMSERLFYGTISNYLDQRPFPYRYKKITYWDGVKKDCKKDVGFALNLNDSKLILEQLETIKSSNDLEIIEVDLFKNILRLVLNKEAIIVIIRWY